jgi:hypothetical protein
LEDCFWAVFWDVAFAVAGVELVDASVDATDVTGALAAVN